MSTDDPLRDPHAPWPALPPAPAHVSPPPGLAGPVAPAHAITTEPPPPRPLFPGDQPGRPHPGFFWAIIWCVFFILVTQIPGGLVGAFLVIILMMGNPGQMANIDPRNTAELLNTPAGSIGMGAGVLVAQILGIAFSWLVIRLVVGRDWPRQLALRLPSIGHLFLVLAAFPAMVLFANLYTELVKDYLPSMKDLGLPGIGEMVGMFKSWPIAFAVLVIGLGPGIGEELWCRGFLGRGLVGRYGVWLGVLLTSFFFGAIHVDPTQGSMALLMGLWLHFIYLMTRSLYVPILVHFLNNSLAMVELHVPALASLDAPPGGWPREVVLPLVGTTLLLLGVVAWALHRSRARLVGVEGGSTVWQPMCRPVETPPEGSGVRVMTPTPSLVSVVLVLAALAAFGWALTVTIKAAVALP